MKKGGGEFREGEGAKIMDNVIGNYFLGLSARGLCRNCWFLW